MKNITYRSNYLKEENINDKSEGQIINKEIKHSIKKIKKYEKKGSSINNDVANKKISLIKSREVLELNQLEKAYEENIADINNYVTGNKNIADYMNENMDTLVNKSEEANKKIHGLYDTMVNELADVNKEVADIYNNWLPHIMDMTTKNELLAESISKI